MQVQEVKERKSRILEIPIVRFVFYAIVGIVFLFAGVSTISLNVYSIELSIILVLMGVGAIMIGTYNLKKSLP